MNEYDNYEVRALIEACRERDDAAFAELVNRYTPLMNKLVSGFDDVALSYDDMFTEATVALHTAALHFDLSKEGITFGLFARICIYRRLKDHVRHAEPSPEIVDFDVEGVEGEQELEEKIVHKERITQLLLSAQKNLSEYEYKVLILHIQGFKSSQRAAKLQKNAKSVDNAKARIFRRLREIYGSLKEIY